MATMTSDQVSTLKRLSTERVMSDADHDRLWKILGTHESRDTLQTSEWAERAIAWLLRREVKEAPRVPVTVIPARSTEALAPGVYRCNGTTYVVKSNKTGTQLYASEVHEIGGQRLTQAGQVVSFELRYARGMMRHLRLSHRLALEDAAPLMIRYGRCLCCNRSLKAAKSVREGIGPVCASRYFG